MDTNATNGQYPGLTRTTQEDAVDTTHAQADSPQPFNLDLSNFTDWAEDATSSITAALDTTLLSPEADFLWDVSASILEKHARRKHPEDISYQRLSSVLMLEMLLASPAAVQSALQRLRDGLLKEDPKVATLRATLAGTPPA